MITQDQLVYIGYLSRTHGKQGSLQCTAENDLLSDSDSEWLILEIEGIPVPFRLDDWREKGADAYILTLRDIDTEDKALRLCGSRVFLLRREVSDNPEEALTMQELVGFRVIDDKKGDLGEIEEVDESTMNALFLLSGDVVIPAHDDFVRDIDYEKKALYLSLPDGLLDL